MSTPMIAAAGLMMICCSSSSVMMMGGGDDDDKKKKAAGAGAGAGAGAEAYSESCDDLGGGVIVRHESGKDLGVCKTDCSDDLDCLGFIHGEEVGFCQLHDNKDPYGVDICDKGLKVYRK